MLAAVSVDTGVMHPLASEVIKGCIPRGQRKPFPANCMSLMTVSGAKGSTVNFSQIACLLGQQVSACGGGRDVCAVSRHESLWAHSRHVRESSVVASWSRSNLFRWHVLPPAMLMAGVYVALSKGGRGGGLPMHALPLCCNSLFTGYFYH